MISRIAMLRAGALGDVILTLPAVQWLRHRYPDASIEAVGYPETWDVAGNLVDTVQSIDARLFSSLYAATTDPDLAAWASHFDLVVAWTVREPSHGLQRAGVPRVIWASPYPPPSRHAASWLLESLSADPTCSNYLSTWRLPLGDRELEEGRDILARLDMDRPILLHPGAGAAWKRWPVDRYAYLARRIRDNGREVALVEGPADADLVSEVLQHVALPVIRGVSARKLATVLAHALCFVGNDSGVTHLAAVTGVPTVALFGPTDPAAWHPMGAAWVLRQCTEQGTGRESIRVCHNPLCMESLTVEHVHRHVEKCVENCPVSVERGAKPDD